MANTFTNLIRDAYAALNVVSRERTGFILAAARDASADRLAVGASLRSGVPPVNTAGKDITAAMAFPAAAYQTIGNKAFTISKARAFPFSWSATDSAAIDTGPGFLTVKQGQIAEAIRAANNEVETDLAVACAQGASRAYGTAAATPFGTNTGETAQLKKILDDNGAPESDRHLILNTAAGAALRTLGQLTKANEAGSDRTLRQGVLLDLNGFAIRESAKVQTPTAGTGASYVADGAHAIGATAILVKTGTGTVLEGDVLTIGAHKYVVAVGGNIAAAGTLTINAPGLQAALADGGTVTVNAAAARNTAFSRNALLLGTRLPEMPPEGDLAVLRETLIDPLTGIAYELAVYPGYRMVHYEVGLSWGVKVEKTEHMAELLG